MLTLFGSPFILSITQVVKNNYDEFIHDLLGCQIESRIISIEPVKVIISEQNLSNTDSYVLKNVQ